MFVIPQVKMELLSASAISKDHGPKFWDYLFEMQQSNSLCDVQLGVMSDAGRLVTCTAHKIILAASSGYYSHLLIMSVMAGVTPIYAKSDSTISRFAILICTIYSSTGQFAHM